MPFDFSTITELRLARGNHKSPDEGLCFLELAAYFAGEEHSDKPDCVCPVLGAYGVRLNDSMPDGVRDRLLKPLVPLIVGTRDKASELKRAEFLAMWAVNRVLPIILRARGFGERAEACERAKTLGEAKDAAYAAYAAANAAADAAADAEQIWTVAVEGLRQAIMLGRHDGFADPLPVIVERRQKLSELVG